MKIVHVLNHFLPEQTAGTEIYVWALSKELISKGISCTIVIPNYGSNETVLYEYDGIRIFKYAEPSHISKELQMGICKPIGLSNFLSVITYLQPDIINFHELAGSNGIGISHVTSAKEKGFKIVMTFHLAGYSCKSNSLMYKGIEICDGLIEPRKCSYCYLTSKKKLSIISPLLVETSWLLNLMHINPYLAKNSLGTAFSMVQQIEILQSNLNKLINASNKIVVLTEFYRNALLLNKVSIKKIEFIPQGFISFKPYLINNKKIRIDKNLKLVFVGRISEFKGLHLLLQAIVELPQYSISLDIYGKPDSIEYEQKCNKLISNNELIVFHGVIDHTEIVNTLSQYDVLCLCSTFSEMSPLVIQEAFAANIPVIASNVKGNAELVKHGVNGLLFTFNNIDSLKEQLERCILEDGLLKELTSNVIPPYPFTKVASSYLNLYEKILN